MFCINNNNCYDKRNHKSHADVNTNNVLLTKMSDLGVTKNVTQDWQLSKQPGTTADIVPPITQINEVSLWKHNLPAKLMC